MTKTQVERNFGRPEQTRPAVGQPPISRWVYGDFTVYFEGDYTLHAVSHHAPKPAPAVVSGSTTVSELPPIEEIDRAGEAGTPDKRPRFHFDPASGRMVELDTDGQPLTQEPAQEPSQAPAPEQPAAQPSEAAQDTASEPASQPEPEAPAATPAKDEDEPRFRFDPTTGRIVLDEAPATGAAKAAPQDAAPASSPEQPAAPEPEAEKPQEAAPAEPAEADSDGGGFFMQW
ncbi:MAG: hypothetical protein LAT61_04210 [Alcanivorax sp.]|nr:hypothetical protein [Alcanivorax sp.]